MWDSTKLYIVNVTLDDDTLEETIEVKVPTGLSTSASLTVHHVSSPSDESQTVRSSPAKYAR